METTESKAKTIKLRTLDFETTGLFEENRPDPEVIEVGFTDVEIVKDEEGNFGVPTIVHEFQAYVKSEVLVTHKARAVHHIPQSVIDTAPLDQSEWRDLVIEPNGWKPDIFVAHNAEFEKKFFNPENSFWICTFKAARRIWPDYEQHTNQYLRYRLGLDDLEAFETCKAMPPHAALPDTYTTAFILKQLLTETTVNDLIKYTRMPLYYPTVPMGAHYGKKWADVPAKYLEWIIGNVKEEDLVAAAREEYDSRRR